MTLDLISIPLAVLAGVLGILSPCVWPLVPVVMSSAAISGRGGPLALALGLSVAFAVAGTVLTLLLLNLGLDPVIYRTFAAVLLVAFGLTLVVKPLGDWLALRLSMLSARLNNTSSQATHGSQFAIGALLGLVWLPCVGPTLGAAVALASMGQSFLLAFVVMFAFGVGTAGALIVAALASTAVLNRLRPGLLARAAAGKQLLGALLVGLGLLVLTGVDKLFETWALQVLPDWALSL